MQGGAEEAERAARGEAEEEGGAEACRSPRRTRRRAGYERGDYTEGQGLRRASHASASSVLQRVGDREARGRTVWRVRGGGASCVAGKSATGLSRPRRAPPRRLTAGPGPRTLRRAMPHHARYLFVCTNRRAPGHAKGSCAEAGSEALVPKLKALLADLGGKGVVRACASGCLDLREIRGLDRPGARARRLRPRDGGRPPRDCGGSHPRRCGLAAGRLSPRALDGGDAGEERLTDARLPLPRGAARRVLLPVEPDRRACGRRAARRRDGRCFRVRPLAHADRQAPRPRHAPGVRRRSGCRRKARPRPGAQARGLRALLQGERG